MKYKHCFRCYFITVNLSHVRQQLAEYWLYLLLLGYKPCLAGLLLTNEHLNIVRSPNDGLPSPKIKTTMYSCRNNFYYQSYVKVIGSIALSSLYTAAA